MELDLFLARVKKLRAHYPVERTSKHSGLQKSKRIQAELIASARRAWQPGDDLRYIDWKQAARLDKLYIKTSQAPSKGLAYIILDDSISMHFKKKYTLAVNLAIGFIYLLLLSHDDVMFSTLAEKPEKLKINHIKNIYNSLNSSSTTSKNKIDLNHSMLQLLKSLKRNQHIFFISDLYCSAESLINFIKTIKNNKCKITLFHLMTSEELIGPNSYGNVYQNILDSETGNSYLTKPENIVNIAERIKLAVKKRKHLALKYGASYNFISDDKDILFYLQKLLNANV